MHHFLLVCFFLGVGMPQRNNGTNPGLEWKNYYIRSWVLKRKPHKKRFTSHSVFLTSLSSDQLYPSPLRGTGLMHLIAIFTAPNDDVPPDKGGSSKLSKSESEAKLGSWTNVKCHWTTCNNILGLLPIWETRFHVLNLKIYTPQTMKAWELLHMNFFEILE